MDFLMSHIYHLVIQIDTNLKELIINRVFGWKASYPSYCLADLDCIV